MTTTTHSHKHWTDKGGHVTNLTGIATTLNNFKHDQCLLAFDWLMTSEPRRCR